MLSSSLVFVNPFLQKKGLLQNKVILQKSLLFLNHVISLKQIEKRVKCPKAADQKDIRAKADSNGSGKPCPLFFRKCNDPQNQGDHAARQADSRCQKRCGKHSRDPEKKRQQRLYGGRFFAISCAAMTMPRHVRRWIGVPQRRSVLDSLRLTVCQRPWHRQQHILPQRRTAKGTMRSLLPADCTAMLARKPYALFLFHQGSFSVKRCLRYSSCRRCSDSLSSTVF